MQSLGKKMKRILSAGLLSLMVVTAMLSGVTQFFADGGTKYEVSYDKAAGKVVGAPEIGQEIKVGDIIKIADTVPQDTYVNIIACNFEEEAIQMGYSSSKQLMTGEQVAVADLRSYLSANKSGFKVLRYEYEDYENGDFLNIYLLALDQPTKLENITMEFDWSKFEAEIGGTLSPDNFKEGFIKTEGFTSDVWFYDGRVDITKADGTTEPVGEGCVINETDSYRVELIIPVAEGYYLLQDDEVKANDETAKSVNPFEWYSAVWADEVSVVIDLGTGAEMIERMNDAKEAATKVEKDETTDSKPDGFSPVAVAVGAGVVAAGAGVATVVLKKKK